MKCRPRLASCLLALVLVAVSPLQVVAHGDPVLDEHRILIIPVARTVAGDGELSSVPFELIVPAMTVEILWRVKSEQKDRITFSVFSGNTVLAHGLQNEAKSRIPKAKQLTIGAVAGTEIPFVVEVFAHIVHWH